MSDQIKFDVFVSFRGEDIRKGFLSHLIDTFQRKKINAFVDYKLERGDEVWPSLVRAIERSFISLIIFSPGYASSRWCLKELVTILECRDKYGRIVIPVFYEVEPTDARHQSGCYKDAFDEHGRKYKTEVQIWRDALKKSADISGIESSKFQDDAGLLNGIVNLVLRKLPKPAVNSEILVGIKEKIEDVERLIQKEPKKTRLIGIWGMGGIGKSTLAEQVFIKLSSEYDGCHFLANEREQSMKHGIISLKKEIFSGLLADDVKIDTPNSLPDNRIRRMKVLIVLDDVNDSDHQEKLLGTLDDFGLGSRIIVTTRDELVLKANRADDIYGLRDFSHIKALELFNLNAFVPSDDQREYNVLSERVVNYAKGIPLVLKLLARHLREKNKEEWESELDRLEKMSLPKVYDIMKLSYDDLDRKEKQIFLDLACFFLRLPTKVNVSDLKSLLKDGESDNSVVVGLERLKNKALITFSQGNFISMHDSLQEMAWEIVRRESVEDPRSRSRLWDPNDICEALQKDKGTKGTKAIRSMQIHLPSIKEQKLSPDIFATMSVLRFLAIFRGLKDGCVDQQYILAEGLQLLETELRFLYWDYSPLKSLPDNFSAEKLVILRLEHSSLEKLWDGVKNLVNLKELNLSFSTKLKKLPDLSKATNLEVLVLRSSPMLASVHPSILSLPKLETLDLFHCRSLTILASDSHLCSLSYLNLDGCGNLTEFSVISENMKELGLKDTKVKALPSSFGRQSKLISLRLGRSAIERLPSSFNDLTKLVYLDVSCCRQLQTIAELPCFLETLKAQFSTSLQTLPKLPQSLRRLDVNSCKSLQSLPELPQSLRRLDVKSCESLQSLPELPRSLETLNVTYCGSLRPIQNLPPSLKTLDVQNSYFLQTLPELPPFLETLNVDFTSLQSLPELPHSLKTLDVKCCFLLKTIQNLPPSLKTLNFQRCCFLQTLPELPPFLETLNVDSCGSLQSLPELPRSLETLNADHCTSLQSLPELPQSLETLDVKCCSSLQTIQNLPPSLKTLNVRNCYSLQTLPELPPFLETLNVNECESLQNLPKLPLSLKTLIANNCKSLKSVVLFPSTAVEQLEENKKRVWFWKCLNLDEPSLVAIGLNSQINVMKFANQFLFSPKHHHVPNDDDYTYNPDCYQAIYIYPGSSVPEWLEYKTRKDYIKIDLSSAPPSSLLGFIFCFVLNPQNKNKDRIEVNITISDGEGKKCSVKMHIDTWVNTIESDHVCVIYDQRCSAFLNGRPKNQTKFKIQVTTTGSAYYSIFGARARPLKEFGVSPTSTTAYNRFIQQMESGSASYHPRYHTQ